MERFAIEHGVPYETCGKLIVALDSSELGRLADLEARGRANGVPGLRMIGPREMAEIEPHAAGIRALHVPGTGIIDFGKVVEALTRQLVDAGVDFYLGHEVTGLQTTAQTTVLRTTRGEIEGRRLIACAGLHSDRVARLDSDPNVQIVPFRGDYYTLTPEARGLCRGLIYPVPDPSLPFLGVHFTRRIDGAVWAGPNAVLATAREGYRRTTVDLRDLVETVRYPGFRRLAEALLANRSPGGLARCHQGRLRQAAAAIRARGAFRPAEFWAGGGAGPSRRCRRGHGRRLHVGLDSDQPARSQRTEPGRDRVVGYRRAHRRPGRSGARPLATAPHHPRFQPIRRSPLAGRRAFLHLLSDRGQLTHASSTPNRADRCGAEAPTAAQPAVGPNRSAPDAPGLGAAAQRRRAAAARGGRPRCLPDQPAGRQRLPDHRARVRGDLDSVVPRRWPVPVAACPVGAGRPAVHLCGAG